ncbi:MAG: ATP synthase F0 subunit B [Polyangiaceae bacterium]|nr:ATP synthase F0 subunit B [Polyangiaceae bacterium]
MTFASLDGVLLAAAPQAIRVDFDSTFLIQVVLFVALTLALKPLLFDPMLRVFEERERLTDGAKAQARHLDEEAAGALAHYESELAKARAAGAAEREKVRAEGVRREQEILAQVREATARVIEEGKRKAQEDAARARAALGEQSNALAKDLAARVLGREVQS